MNTAGRAGASGSQRRARRDVQRPRAGALKRRASGPLPPRRSRRGWNRHRWQLTAGLAAMLALAGTAGWVVLGSPLFDTRAVQVVGTRELSADTVLTVAAVPLGTSLLRLDTEGIETRVAALPRVATVRVSRTLGGTVRIAVTERTPIAVWPGPDGVHLVDATGTAYLTVARAPRGLPELRLARVGPGDDRTIAALTVLTELPGPLRAQVLSVAARSPADVVLRLTEGRVVRWGDVADGDRKAAVLGPLLTQPGEIYDVSSPDLPTIS